eukprot:765546-Hanusia_phi.AAC.5
MFLKARNTAVKPSYEVAGSELLQRTDQFEYHGDFMNGKMHGGGKYFSKKGFRFTGFFKDGNPFGVGYMDDEDGTRYKVEYDGKVSLEEGAIPLNKEEISHKPYIPGRVSCIACKKVILNGPQGGGEEDAYSHIRNITARLVLARPPFADVPLWNADEVRGKICAIMRGPKPPAEMVSFTTKLYHAQLAGAVAVEGATHIIAFPPVKPGTNPGYRAGMLGCPRQESKFGISKNEAEALMKEFFSARKNERLQEQEFSNQKSPLPNSVQDPEASDSILADLNQKIMRRVLGKIEGIAGQQNWEWLRFRASTMLEPLMKPNDAATSWHSAKSKSEISTSPEKSSTRSSNQQTSSEQKISDEECRKSGSIPVENEVHDASNGYHVIESRGIIFAGYLRNRLPHGFCEMKWPDGTEIHAFFVEGELEGKGKYFFADGHVYEGSFVNGRPTEGLLHDNDSKKYFVSYKGDWPLWDGAQPTTKEEVCKEIIDGKAHCIGLCINQPILPDADNNSQFSYEHIRNISGRLVWARPQFADMPIWNADQVRGKIVVVRRGPRPFAPPCNYSKKLHFCQQAGAIGMIVLDWDPSNKFSMIPKLEGPPQKDGTCTPVQVKIPCCMVLNRAEPLLQEGAILKLSFAPPDYEHQPEGWRVGYVICPKQESGCGLPQKQAEELMNEFLAARKAERSTEIQMIESKNKKLNCMEQELAGKEWIDGNVFSSLIPDTRESQSLHSTRYEITKEVMSRLTSPQKAAQIASDTDEYLTRMETQLRDTYKRLSSTTLHEGQDNPPKQDDAVSPCHRPNLQVIEGAVRDEETGQRLRSIVEIKTPSSAEEPSDKRDVAVQCEEQRAFWENERFDLHEALFQQVVKRADLLGEVQRRLHRKQHNTTPALDRSSSGNVAAHANFSSQGLGSERFCTEVTVPQPACPLASPQLIQQSLLAYRCRLVRSEASAPAESTSQSIVHYKFACAAPAAFDFGRRISLLTPRLARA